MPLKFISAPRKDKHFIGQLWQLMTASNVGAWTQAWQARWAVFKIEGFVCKHFLPFFPTPSTLFYLRRFSHGLWLLFLILCSYTAQKHLLRRLARLQSQGIMLRALWSGNSMEGRLTAVVLQEDNYWRLALLSGETPTAKAGRCWEILPGDESKWSHASHPEAGAKRKWWWSKLVPTSFSCSKRRQRDYQSEEIRRSKP